MTDRISSVEVLVSSPVRNYVTLRLTTADGLVGLGDATVNGRELAVAAYLSDHVGPLLDGLDPGRIEDIWQYLYRGAYWRRGPITMAAIGAVDMALWDIRGRRGGSPFSQPRGARARAPVPSCGPPSGGEPPRLRAAVAPPRARGARHIRVQS